MNIALIMMGGKGTRFGDEVPKQYHLVGGKPVFLYIVEAYQKLDCIDHIVIVSNEMWIPFVHEWLGKIKKEKISAVVPGGDTRSASVHNGLLACRAFADDDAIVAIHDATHPYVDAEGTREVIEAVKLYRGATLGTCQYDTCYRIGKDDMIEAVVPRQELITGASPEAFYWKELLEIYDKSTREELEAMTSAGAMAAANGIQMKVVKSGILNLKITYPEDMELFKKLVNNYFFT